MPNQNNYRSANRTQPQEEQAAGPSHLEKKPPRDKRRKEAFRKKKSEETSSMEKKAVYEHLYFGFNNMSNALSSLQVSVNPRTVIVPITTRGVGFIIRAIVARLTRLAIRQLEPVPLAAALYRITLLALEAKVGIAKEQTPATHYGSGYTQFDVSYDYVRKLGELGANFSPIANYIASLGSFTAFNTRYLPRVPNQLTDEAGIIQHHPSLVTFSSLRQTVVALSDQNTTRMVRDRFYELNPIPIAQWTRPRVRNADGQDEGNWRLLNPDEKKKS